MSNSKISDSNNNEKAKADAECKDKDKDKSNVSKNTTKLKKNNIEEIPQINNNSSCCTCIMKSFTTMVANKFSFNAPNPPNYYIKINSNYENKDIERLNAYKNIDFYLKNGTSLQQIINSYPFLRAKSYYVSKLKREKYIKEEDYLVLLQIINKNSHCNDDSVNILFCHGNATDLGDSLGMLIDLATQLKCNVYAFDYTGYGCSKGDFSEQRLYKDMDTIIHFLTINMPKPIKLSTLLL